MRDKDMNVNVMFWKVLTGGGISIRFVMKSESKYLGTGLVNLK